MRASRDTRRRCILGVFAHPDDETIASSGTFARYVRDGVVVYVATTTRGELGTLGAGEAVIAREQLPAIREAELRAALEMCGAQPPILLGYSDQGLKDADFEELVGKVVSVMNEVTPDAVITFGPTGISHHEDHIIIHQAATEAFHQWRATADPEPRLFYLAIPEAIAKGLELDLHESELRPTVLVDVSPYWSLKVRALRTYRSQKDMRELAEMLESSPWQFEAYHQAYPLRHGGRVASDLWE